MSPTWKHGALQLVGLATTRSGAAAAAIIDCAAADAAAAATLLARGVGGRRPRPCRPYAAVVAAQPENMCAWWGCAYGTRPWSSSGSASLSIAGELVM